MARDVYMLFMSVSVFIVCVVLVHAAWSIQYVTLPTIRQCALYDRIMYHPHLWHPKLDTQCMHDSLHDTHTCRSCHYLMIGGMRTYEHAVRYGVYIRDMYHISCDIRPHDSVTRQNMVSWYTLVSQTMPNAVCDAYVRMLQRCEDNICVEKRTVNKR